MMFSFATSAALLLLCAAASCAPAPSSSVHGACEDVGRRSVELLNTVKDIRALNGSKVKAKVNSELLWMEGKDGCDPSSLRENPAQCIEKILRVLMNYSAVMNDFTGFEICSESANKLKPVMEELVTKMTTCLKSKTGTEFHINPETPRITPYWEKKPLFDYTMDRLFSFSILTARVFAAGDPSQHGSTQNPPCPSVG